MSMHQYQKKKLLLLSRILEQESDQEHPLSVPDILKSLERLGVLAERKSIYDDLHSLEELGIDLVRVGNRYYMGERTLELAQLKLLVDAVQACRFISQNKTGELIGRLQKLCSIHESGALMRQVQIMGRPKTENQAVLYNVDRLHAALGEGVQITYRYFDWQIVNTGDARLKKQYRHQGKRYRVSPWGLVWEGEYYYLIAYDSETQMIRHYRVDRMEDILLLKEHQEGQVQFMGFDLARYSKKVFGMFGGQEERVQLRFTNRMLGVVVDRFGSDVFWRPDGAENFIITVQVVVSPQFLSWLFGLEQEVEVLAPQSLKERYLTAVKKVLAQYE